MKLKLANLTITRSGQVAWHVVPGSTHCGPAPLVKQLGNGDGMLEVRYELKLVCEPRLDARGFLVDQVNIHAYIERFASKPRTLSCEQTAIELATSIIMKAAIDAPHCIMREVSLLLSPEPFLASITAQLIA